MKAPKFYNPKKVSQVYQPEIALAMAEGTKLRNKVAPASDDFKNNSATALLIVDPQNDFCQETGTLSVPGAIGDMQRLIGFIYTNLGEISTIIVSQDSHLPYQIFFQSWWKGRDGQSPDPFTAITYNDFETGIWRPAVGNLVKKTEAYLRHLKQQSKKTLVVWPYHCMIDTPGHAVVSALSEAIAFHSAAKMTQTIFIPKGNIAFSEHYSIWEPEMHVTGYGVQGELNSAMLDQVARHSRIFIAGEAENFCVDESMRSKEKYFANSPDVLAKFKFLTDCTSPVPVPGYEKMVTESRKRMKRLGIKIVKSTDRI